jgi:hypothetical protein
MYGFYNISLSFMQVEVNLNNIFSLRNILKLNDTACAKVRRKISDGHLNLGHPFLYFPKMSNLYVKSVIFAAY